MQDTSAVPLEYFYHLVDYSLLFRGNSYANRVSVFVCFGGRPGLRLCTLVSEEVEASLSDVSSVLLLLTIAALVSAVLVRKRLGDGVCGALNSTTDVEATGLASAAMGPVVLGSVCNNTDGDVGLSDNVGANSDVDVNDTGVVGVGTVVGFFIRAAEVSGLFCTATLV